MMKEFSTLFNTTNTFIPRRDDVEEIIAAALNAADPYTAVVLNTRLYKNHAQIGRHEYSLTPRSRLIVIGLGKRRWRYLMEIYSLHWRQMAKMSPQMQRALLLIATRSRKQIRLVWIRIVSLRTTTLTISSGRWVIYWSLVRPAPM